MFNEKPSDLNPRCFLMSKTKKIKLGVNKLVPGLYVDLELSWAQHPFLFRRFKIKSVDEIAVIKDLGLNEVTVFPDKSKAEVPEPGEKREVVKARNKDELWESKKQRIDNAAKYRHSRHKTSKRYMEQIKRVKNLTNKLKSAPANAMRDAWQVIDEMAEAFDGDGHVMINLVNLADERFTVHHHSLNVSVLTLSLAKAMNIRSVELRQLGVGAILHDIGKVALPTTVLMKQTPLNSSEQKLLDTHPALGGRLVQNAKDIPEEVQQIIEQHHESLDGSGFPHGFQGEQISKLARIVAITNAYDNLCNPNDPKAALTPKAAMAVLYAKYKNKLDTEIVQRFIQTMGVYPPGTVVQLSDESIGLVIAVDHNALLLPKILLYHPDVPRTEALHIDLKEHSDLKIVDALKPGSYPARIYEYLGIRERLGYFYETS